MENEANALLWNYSLAPSVITVGVKVETDDRTLIAECLAGRPAAFGVLVQRYQDRLYGSIVRIVGHSEDARDIVQEAFLLAYQSLGGFKGDSQFFTWLYRIAVNAAISWKRKRREILSMTGVVNGQADLEPADTSAFNQPSDLMERAEEDHRLLVAIEQLPLEYRSVLVMKELDGLKYEEMAEILAVPIGTIRSRLHRARLELRELLQLGESS
jgi:RNA polymerase sigma-70 factor (ECF subfamily)